ncbi:hypothetical protein [Burkholderia multivorans]|uniref:hypothetical protein n=1 Tax=Burkholderia multivorans TaxID=87883 RepID=UPI003D65C4F4
MANQSGELVSESTVAVRGGAIANNRGTIQSAAGMTIAGASLDNTAGRITSLNSDGLTVTTGGELTNAAGTTANGAQGGVIGGNGDVTVQGGNVANHGRITSNANLQVSGQSVANAGRTEGGGRCGHAPDQQWRFDRRPDRHIDGHDPRQ